MKEIPLKRGLVALVDDEDYELVKRYKWRPCPDRGNPPKYRAITAMRINGKTMTIAMHRLIFDLSGTQRADHINRNSLDNRRVNLRAATPMQNTWNTSLQRDARIPFKGVCRHPQPGLKRPYIARIQQNGTNYHLGFYAQPEAAAKAYDAKAKELFGEFAYLNFPDTESATN